MPEVDRSVVGGYCYSPGPLEPAPQPTFLAVSPASLKWAAQSGAVLPWSAARRASALGSEVDGPIAVPVLYRFRSLYCS